jgi:hypothetical protein
MFGGRGRKRFVIYRGIVAAKYPAKRHIKIAPMVVVMIEQQRSTKEYGISVSMMVMS